jgi:hypothetical protein
MSFGYHVTNIEKGKLGFISKIQEELDELRDAEKQGSKIMMMVDCQIYMERLKNIVFNKILLWKI